MSNMPYCRFRSTLSDLRDCYEQMEDDDDLPKDESKARERLIRLCQDIVTDYGDDD